MDKPTQRVVIITGAVGNLGLATAHAFQAAGDKTVLVDRSHDKLRDAFGSVAASPDHLLAGGVDLSAAASLSKLIADNSSLPTLRVPSTARPSRCSGRGEARREDTSV